MSNAHPPESRPLGHENPPRNANRLRSLGEIAAGLVHEFSQPVSGIRGFAEGLLLAKQRGWDVPDEQLVNGLQEIVNLTGRMAELIDHVRNFARSSQLPEIMPMQLSDVVDGALMMVGRQFRAHGVSFRVLENEDTPVIEANPFALEEALLAVLKNAHDAVLELSDGAAADRFCIEIHIQPTTLKQSGHPAAMLEVRDGAGGMSPEVLGKACTPFFSTKASDKGMGLGLNSAQQAVEGCGGTFSITSTEGEGTRVAFAFPATGTRDQAARPAAQPDTP